MTLVVSRRANFLQPKEYFLSANLSNGLKTLPLAPITFQGNESFRPTVLPLVIPFAKLTHSLPGSGNLLLTLGCDPTIPGAFASENIVLRLCDSGLPTATSRFVESGARSFIPTC